MAAGIGAILLLVAAYFVNQRWEKENREALAQQRLMQAYDRATDPVLNAHSAPQTSTVQLPKDMIEAQARRERLINHPAVTPGLGFDMPGVQSTGIAIIDAIDHAKAVARPQ